MLAESSGSAEDGAYYFDDDGVAKFHMLISRVVADLKRAEPKQPWQIILLIDEFTEIYKCILYNKLSRDFMKMWKGLVERKYFSSVLVGQDIMPAFLDAFPN